MTHTAATKLGGGTKAETATGTIGLVGLGLLGCAMAERLVRHGFRVVGFDPNAGRAEAFTATGGLAASNAAKVFADCRRIVLSLPDSAAVGSVLEQAPADLRDGQVVIDTTTGAQAAA